MSRMVNCVKLKKEAEGLDRMVLEEAGGGDELGQGHTTLAATPVDPDLDQWNTLRFGQGGSAAVGLEPTGGRGWPGRRMRTALKMASGPPG